MFGGLGDLFTNSCGSCGVSVTVGRPSVKHALWHQMHDNEAGPTDEVVEQAYEVWSAEVKRKGEEARETLRKFQEQRCTETIPSTSLMRSATKQCWLLAGHEGDHDYDDKLAPEEAKTIF